MYEKKQKRKKVESMEDLKIIQLYWEREESAIIQTKEKYGKTMEQLAYRLLFDYQDTEECCSVEERQSSDGYCPQ